MNDDLVSRLRDAHANSTQRIVGSNIFDEAATALTEARAEIERLTERHDFLAAGFGVPDGGRYLADWQTRISKFKATESELSTLRARVREVVGGMLAHSCVADAGQDCKDEEDEAAERAARQLMEEVK